MTEEKRISEKNQPYPENESCLRVGCIRYGRDCHGGDPLGQEVGADYCRDRIIRDPSERRCFGNIDPDDAKCVPNCLKNIQCYNKMQEDARS